MAAGLRVPSPLAGHIILANMRESGGDAVAVPDRVIVEATLRLAREEGIFAAPEAGAALAALEMLLEQGKVDRDERVIVFLTGSGIRYLGALGDPS
jgi:threonine synthase